MVRKKQSGLKISLFSRETKKKDDDVSVDRRYKCKVVKNGQKKINKMAKDLKTYSKSIKKMSKFLNDFTNY